MNTERLYYQDAYMREFSATILARREIGGRLAVALDRTAFYPTGGGQPHDTGMLTPAGGTGSAVSEVTVENGLVWHVLAAPVAGAAVHGAVDWDRRFDHMQQHTGQHVLSQAFVGQCDAETVAFHMGEIYSTIDLNRVDLTPAALAAAESAANAIVDAAAPVTAAYVTPAELAALPLRKPPKVTEDIRIVQVQGFDWSACGGTHVANTAAIGLIKIVATERRGPELRVTFLCGRRARADYTRLKILAQGLVARFTTAEDEILEAVDRRAAEADALRKELADLERQWAEATAAALWAQALPVVAGRAVVVATDYGVERAKRVAQALRAHPDAIVVVGVRGERPQLLCTRADNVAVDAGALLRSAVAAGAGRGGGRPDWAQGGVPTDAALDLALEAARAQLVSPVRNTR